jgi:hypothetical protein
MTLMIDVYTSATSATSTSAIELVGDPQQASPWFAVSSGRAADQMWFWTPEWQEGEREVDEHIAAGRTTYFDSADEFLAALEREIS